MCPKSMGRSTAVRAGVVALTLSLSGCGAGETEVAGAQPSPDQSGSSSLSASAVHSVTPSPSAPPKSAPPSPAADGRNHRACSDGVCEVAVRSGDVLPIPKRQGGPVSIGPIADDHVTMGVGSLTGFYGLGGMEFSQPGGEPLEWTIIRIDGDRAEIRFGASTGP